MDLDGIAQIMHAGFEDNDRRFREIREDIAVLRQEVALCNGRIDGWTMRIIGAMGVAILSMGTALWGFIRKTG